jgi:microcystin degradation protein MlrC
MNNLRDDILRLIATAKPSAADCIAVPVSVGALYAARMNVSEEDFVRMCRQAFGGGVRVWRDHDRENSADPFAKGGGE